MKIFSLADITTKSRRYKFRFKTCEELVEEYDELEDVPGGWNDNMNCLFGVEFSMSQSRPETFKITLDGMYRNFTITPEMYIEVRKRTERIRYLPKTTGNRCEDRFWEEQYARPMNIFFETVLQHHSGLIIYKPDSWYSYARLDSGEFVDRLNNISLLNVKHVALTIPNMHTICLDWLGTFESASFRRALQEQSANYDESKPIDYIVFSVGEPMTGRKVIAVYYMPDNVLYSCDIGHFKSIHELRLREQIQQSLLTHGVKPRSKKKNKTVYEPVTILLGADPEFETFNSSRGVFSASSHDYLCNLERATYSEVELGLDGAGTVAELRPKPADSPFGLVQNLAKIMQDADLNDLQFTTKGDTYASGGHIHAGFQGKMHESDSKLERILASLLLTPLKCLNGKARGSYGIRNPFESKSYGFEYRLLPASVFENPVMAYLTLKIFKGIVEDYFSGKYITIKPRINYDLYSNWLTEKEYNVWQEMIARLKDKERPLLNCVGFWIDNPDLLKPSKPSNVSFSNDMFSETVKNILTTEFSKYNTKTLFFGFHKEKGKVVHNITAEGFETIPFSMRSSDQLTIGLPYYERVGQEVSPEIIKAIHERLEQAGAVEIVADEKEHTGKKYFMQESLTALAVL